MCANLALMGSTQSRVFSRCCVVWIGCKRVTHLASKNRIPVQTCYAILYEIEQRGNYEITWTLLMVGVPTPFGFREQVDYGLCLHYTILTTGNHY